MAQQRKIQDFFSRASGGSKRRIDEVEEKGNTDTDESNPNVAAERNMEPGTSKRVSDGAKKAKQKHASQFKPEWMKERPWLICKIQSEKEFMFCKLCQDFNNGDVWNTTGCKRIRLESIKDHEQTNEHSNSVSRKMQAEASFHVHEMLTKPKEISHDSMVKAFQCLYWLAKRNIPHTTNFEPLLDLLAQLGLDIKSKISRGQNATYTSDTAIKEILMCLSQVIEEEILDDICKSKKYYSLMFDETTDISTIEQMVIHSRYIDGNGEIATRFMKILDCLDVASVVNDDDQDTETEAKLTLNAEKICNLVTNYITESKLEFSKLVGLGTDGAPVMVGKANGAVKKIIDKQVSEQSDSREPIVKAVGAHCAAHKLNLAAAQAGNAFPQIVRFKKLLHKLHEFFSRSAMRTAGLKAVQNLIAESLDSEDGTSAKGKVQDPSPTRWLALGKCACGLLKILPSVLISLGREGEERGDVLATGLYHQMTRIDFIAVLILLTDVLPTVNRLSCLFQSQSIDFESILTHQQSTLKALEAKKQKPTYADAFTKIIENLQQNDIPVDVVDIEAKLQEFDEQTKQPFINRLMTNITDRFESSNIMQAFTTVSDVSNYTSSENEELDNSIALLSTQFGLPLEELRSEAEDIPHYKSLIESTDFMGTLLTSSTAKQMFKNLSKIAQIYKTLPPHTADCERDFSKMKLVKSDLRNRLKEDTLDCLMRISINGPPPDKFPYIKAVKVWSEKKDRRYKVRLI